MTMSDDPRSEAPVDDAAGEASDALAPVPTAEATEAASAAPPPMADPASVRPKPAPAPAPAKATPSRPAPRKIKAARKPAPKPVRIATAPSFSAQPKDIPMDTSTFKETASTMQDKAREAFTKRSALAGEVGEFTRGNVEAVVESGKILAAGLQEMGNRFVADGKTAFETATSDAKALTAVTSPTEFFQLQTNLLRRNLETAVATTTRNGEAMLKLTNDVFKPITGRVTLAVDKLKSAA